METSQETPWSLRPATEEDLGQLVAIETRVHSHPWTEENFRSELTKPYSQMLLLTDDEKDQDIAGYVVFWFMFEECHILNVAVDLPYRGLGFAKKMIQRVIQMAAQKNVKKLLLDVRKTNFPAIALYQRMGFVITHVRKAFYSNGEDAYQMAFFTEGDPFQF